MLKKLLPCFTTLMILAVTLPAFAKTTATHYKEEPVQATAAPSWLYMGIYGGYGNVSGAYEDDGQFTQGRLALGAHTTSSQRFSFGLETGVQWGNDMRFVVEDFLDFSPGGLPVQTTLKPLVDLLLTLKGTIDPNYPVSVFVKGGVAYRQLQMMDRTSSDDSLREVNGELQAGLGYNVTEHAMLTLFYQGIFSRSSPDITIDGADNVNLGRIPTQQAGFLGIEYSV